jgi:hypothetical protein
MIRLFYILILVTSVYLSQGISKVTSIPFKLSNGLILIKAQVNDDKHATFIFDTGSSEILINGTANTSKKTILESVNGGIVSQKIRLKSIKLGDFKKVGLPAYLTDLSGIEQFVNTEIYGILSGNYFSPNEVFIDLKNKVIEISPSFDFKEYSQLYNYQVSKKDNITVIFIPFRGELLRFGLDSGASSHILSEETLERHQLQFRVIETLNLINHNGKSEETKRILTEAIFDKNPSGNIFLVKDMQTFNAHTSANLDGFLSITSIPADFVYINRSEELCLVGNYK